MYHRYSLMFIGFKRIIREIVEEKDPLMRPSLVPFVFIAKFLANFLKTILISKR